MKTKHLKRHPLALLHHLNSASLILTLIFIFLIPVGIISITNTSLFWLLPMLFTVNAFALFWFGNHVNKLVSKPIEDGSYGPQHSYHLYHATNDNEEEQREAHLTASQEIEEAIADWYVKKCERGYIYRPRGPKVVHEKIQVIWSPLPNTPSIETQIYGRYYDKKRLEPCEVHNPILKAWGYE